MFDNYTEEELRSICRKNIESLEMWARRLIHEKFREKYGTDYVDYKTSAENFLIKREVRDHIHAMTKKEKGRFPRAVDILFFEHIIYFLCNPAFHREIFQDALKYAYPQGYEEAREFLSRLLPIRNALAHSNPISVRQAEQAICYSHDFVDSLKKYYKKRGMEQVWNVPRIIRVTDLFGNVFDNPTETHGQSSIFTVPQEIYCGDTYSLSIDIDSSFSEEDYDIIWENHCKKVDNFFNAKNISLTFKENDVCQGHLLSCQLVSHKAWHKYQFYDCEIVLRLTVLPPV